MVVSLVEVHFLGVEILHFKVKLGISMLIGVEEQTAFFSSDLVFSELASDSRMLAGRFAILVFVDDSWVFGLGSDEHGVCAAGELAEHVPLNERHSQGGALGDGPRKRGSAHVGELLRSEKCLA